MTTPLNLVLVALDLLGTFVFAISGAAVGVRHRLDVFGVLVLSFAAAVSGGIVRDVLIGDTPPAALVGWHYLATSCLAGIVTFLRHEDVEKLRNPVQIFDALGLALFAATGASKALAFGLGPVPAILLGMLSGIGGGIVRDMLVAQIPVILRSELYAVAALAGAAVIVIGKSLSLPDVPMLVLAVGLCFGLRFMAIRFGWRLPVASSRAR
ncbi:MAG TPA: trimeric intracellular cation channel family protein [Dokdonella sp.]|uniref:trimeric intracellular cation channel family protein n=1 Tax=Dokdonella sp. TaxID=2291710 RepID=UPI002C7C7A44|nr:trimeric intracellular cation channel family protein [Dokdonella sp.]HOX70995.1 trimeric intracellular cation channel family protein [Dokdonella sp.]